MKFHEDGKKIDRLSNSILSYNSNRLKQVDYFSIYYRVLFIKLLKSSEWMEYKYVDKVRSETIHI